MQTISVKPIFVEFKIPPLGVRASINISKICAVIESKDQSCSIVLEGDPEGFLAVKEPYETVMAKIYDTIQEEERWAENARSL